MKFYLLARLADDTLVLLEDSGFEDRSSALDALGRVAAEPDFAYRDAELLLMDIDQATPVLMVKPTTQVEVEAFADEELEAAGVAADELSDDDVVAELIAAVAEDLELEEHAAEDAARAESDETVTAEAAEPVADEETALLAEELVIEEAIAAQIVSDAMAEMDVEAPQPQEAPAAPTAVPEPVEAVAEEEVAPAPAPVDLRDALARTTTAMAAEGIVAPESIPPKDQAAAWPWSPEESESAPAEPAEADTSGDVFESSAVVELADEVPPVVEPIAATVAEEPVVAEEPAAAEEPAVAEPEPVETPEAAADDLPDVMPAPAHRFDPFEEPAVDATPLVHAPPAIEDDSEVAEDVAFGESVEPEVAVAEAAAYGIAAAQEGVEPAPAVEPVAVVEPAPSSEPAVPFEPAPPVEPAAPAEPATATEPAKPADAQELSDFILGIGGAPEPPAAEIAATPVEPEAEVEVEAEAEPEPTLPAPEPQLAPAPQPEPAPEPPAFAGVAEPASVEPPAANTASEPLGYMRPSEPDQDSPSFGSDLDALTCEDCVYVATCPNKEQLNPTTCGSFQWKSM